MIIRISKILFFVSLCVAPVARASESEAVVLRSPNGKIALNFSIGQEGSESGLPVYSVSFEGKPVVATSSLGLELQGVAPFAPFLIQSSKRRTHDEIYVLPVGRRHRIRDHFEEIRLELVEAGAQRRRLDLTFRAYDDGLAFRYTLPRQANLTNFVISDEKSTFRWSESPQLFSVQLPFNSSFEGFFTHGGITDVTPGNFMTLPVVGSTPTGIWFAISEAGLTNYAGMSLTPADAQTLTSQLAPSRADPSVKVTGTTPFSSPWRLLMMAHSANDFLTSDLINNLNEPTALADTSWIHPGKVIFPWWNDYELTVDPKDTAPSHQPGLNTWSLKRYIDFCAENQIDNFSLDGFHEAWYGGDIGNPPPEADVTKAIPAIDLPEVLRYGKEKGVRARLWMHQAALAHSPDLDAVFGTYESWGVEGIMIDFLNSDDQTMVQYYTRIIRAAARHHLSVNFHGTWKPTGVTRTYPNLFSQEAVRSSEYNRFDAQGCPPEHEMNYAFIRQLAGPMDVHPGSFRPVAPENWSLQAYPRHAMGTLARELAIYVIMESGMQMVVDAPAAYLAHPEAFDFVRRIPVAWDETRVLSGDLGHVLVMARRKGRAWYVGAMTDRSARSIPLELNFLGPGDFLVESYMDGPDPRNAPEGILVSQRVAKNGDSLSLDLGPSGGAALRITPRH